MSTNFESDTILLNNEYDLYGDTRNRKGLYEEGYTKHNKGAVERTRIYYIKMKREWQSNEDKKKNKKIVPIEEEKKSRKRQLKLILKDENYENNYEKLEEKKKKRKIPKKDRVKL